MDAADTDRAEIARYLLDAGSVMDTSASVRNPLFAAIVGQSQEVVRLLLDRGIDASVRYNSNTMIDMDATAFALWRGETELARIIALHLAGGNEVKAQALLNEAREVVSRNAPLQAVRIVSTIEDLEREQRRVAGRARFVRGGFPRRCGARVVLVERLEEQQSVFNFAVDGFHTYYVGESGVWVHNASSVAEALANIRRNTPGVATASGKLKPASGRWLDAATPTPIPAQVAADLVGREFKTFHEMRAAIWRSIVSKPELTQHFGASSLGNMRRNFAAFAPREFQVGRGPFNQRFNLHHIDPVENGGAVYDLSNLQIVSPKVHRALHRVKR